MHGLIHVVHLAKVYLLLPPLPMRHPLTLTTPMPPVTMVTVTVPMPVANTMVIPMPMADTVPISMVMAVSMPVVVTSLLLCWCSLSFRRGFNWSAALLWGLCALAERRKMRRCGWRTRVSRRMSGNSGGRGGARRR